METLSKNAYLAKGRKLSTEWHKSTTCVGTVYYFVFRSAEDNFLSFVNTRCSANGVCYRVITCQDGYNIAIAAFRK